MITTDDLKIYTYIITVACMLLLALLFSRPPQGRHRCTHEQQSEPEQLVASYPAYFELYNAAADSLPPLCSCHGNVFNHGDQVMVSPGTGEYLCALTYDTSIWPEGTRP